MKDVLDGAGDAVFFHRYHLGPVVRGRRALGAGQVQVDDALVVREFQADSLLALRGLLNALLSEQYQCLAVVDEFHRRCSRPMPAARPLPRG